MAVKRFDTLLTGDNGYDILSKLSAGSLHLIEHSHKSAVPSVGALAAARVFVTRCDERTSL